MLTISSIEHTIDFHKTLFKNISLSVERDDRIALIGNNGVGKSTLLKILAGTILPTKGAVLSNATVFYLDQFSQENYNSQMPIHEFIATQFTEWWEVTLIYEKLFSTSINEAQVMKTLSGGEILKLQLCIGLAQKPDILLLDEPTNHLDSRSKLALIECIQSFQGAVVIASHDVHFINEVATSIWDLCDETINLFSGNFNEYQEHKRVQKEALEKKYEAKKKEIAKLAKSKQTEQNYYHKAIAKSKRLLKSNDRSMSRPSLRSKIPKGETLHSAFKKRMNTIIDKKYEELKTLKGSTLKSISLNLSDTGRKQELLLELSQGTLLVSKSLQLQIDEFEVRYGERILLDGDNGSGKTSFLKSLVSSSPQKQLSGKLYIADFLLFANIDQKFELVEMEKTVFENISSNNPHLSHELVRKHLASFLFLTQEHVTKKAAVLSGGELGRLALAKVTAQPLDLLVMDEPTNNIDIETKEVFVKALLNFKGAILLITHDKSFVERLNIDRVYRIEDNKIITISQKV